MLNPSTDANEWMTTNSLKPVIVIVIGNRIQVRMVMNGIETFPTPLTDGAWGNDKVRPSMAVRLGRP